MEPHATAAPQGSPDAVHQELYALLAACTEEECAAVLTVLRLLVQEEDPVPLATTLLAPVNLGGRQRAAVPRVDAGR